MGAQTHRSRVFFRGSQEVVVGALQQNGPSGGDRPDGPKIGASVGGEVGRWQLKTRRRTLVAAARIKVQSIRPTSEGK
jgi:hypothetical protein